MYKLSPHFHPCQGHMSMVVRDSFNRPTVVPNYRYPLIAIRRDGAPVYADRKRPNNNYCNQTY